MRAPRAASQDAAAAVKVDFHTMRSASRILLIYTKLTVDNIVNWRATIHTGLKAP